MKSWADFGIVLPSGASGEVAIPCPECSATRKKPRISCLSVNTEKLVWVCFNCDWRGTLKGGVEGRSSPNGWKPKVYVRPDYVCTSPPDPVLAWFAARGIHADTVDAFGVTQTSTFFPGLGDWADGLCFPFYRGDEVINIKYRALTEKTFRQVAGAEKILFNLNATAGATEAFVTEGECDAMACWQVGINAMSVPDGAPALNAKPSDLKYEYLVTCHDELEPLKKIVLCTDNDPPGDKLAMELARRLGVERCWRVHWPDGIKDANQCLVELGAETLATLLANPTPWPIDDLITLADVADALVAAVLPPPRLSTGWAKLDTLWGLSPTDSGRLILVTGWPSHGKSEWTDALILNTIQRYQWPWLICSPENMPAHEYVERIVERETGAEFFSLPPDARAGALERLNPFVHLLTPEDMIPIETVLKAARALVLRVGLRGILIDPWNEFDHSRERETSETEYTGMMLGKLRRFARNHGVNVVVIAHPAKLSRNKDGTFPKPTPRDVSGSAHWYNKPDDCLVVWRDASGETPTTLTEIEVAKVRGKRMGTTGKIELWWERHSGRYVETFQGHS